MAFTFLENALNLGISNHAPVPHPKLHAGYFENMFSLTTERGGKNNYDLFFEIQSAKVKIIWNMVIYIFYDL